MITTSATLKNTNGLTIHRQCDGSSVIRNFVRRYLSALHEARVFRMWYYYDHHKTTNKMLTRLVKIIIPRDGYSIRSTKGVPKVTFSFSYTLRVGFGSRVWLIPTLCEIRRIAVLKFHDTDPYSSRIQTYPDVPCSKTCDGLNPWHEISDVRIRHWNGAYGNPEISLHSQICRK